MEEANKLIGAGKKHLVMGHAVKAVSVLQEACGMLAKEFGDTADECGEAFFWCGKALLDLARMENTVLGNALEGVPEEETEEGEKNKDSNVESTENVDEKTRDELRAKVYDAMSEENINGEKDKDGKKAEVKDEKAEVKDEKAEVKDEKAEVKDEKKEDEKKADEKKADEKKADEKMEDEKMEDEKKADEKKADEKMEDEKKADEKKADEKKADEKKADEKMEDEKKADEKMEDKKMEDEKKADEKKADEKMEDEKKADEKKVEGENVEKKGEDEQKATAKEEKDGGVNGASPSDGENKENIEETKEETADKMEGDSGEEEEADDDEDDAKGDGEDAKESDDEEVGNLQLAWEMLEVAKVIYKRKDTKEDQLLAAEAHLKLGEVSSESGNYSQALEDLQECLRLQEKHLEPDSRLLAETHYQLGLTHTFHCQYSQAVQHLHDATAVIKTRLDNLQKIIDKAGDSEEVASEEKEMEELRGLLPELKEKVEDAQEGLKSATAEPTKEMLADGGSTSSAFSAPSVQNGEASSGTTITAKPTNGVSSADGDASKAAVSDISHLVRKKRKPEESPVKEGATKKLKVQEKEEACTNGEKVEKKLDANGEKEADVIGDAANKMEVESQ